MGQKPFSSTPFLSFVLVLFCQSKSLEIPGFLLLSGFFFVCDSSVYIHLCLPAGILKNPSYNIHPYPTLALFFSMSEHKVTFYILDKAPLLVMGPPPWLTVLFWGSRSKASLTVGDLRPSLLIPQCKQRSFLHAWLSSLRKTDGLKFLSLFRMIFFFSGTGKPGLPLQPLTCAAALMWKIEGVRIG